MAPEQLRELVPELPELQEKTRQRAPLWTPRLELVGSVKLLSLRPQRAAPERVAVALLAAV